MDLPRAERLNDDTMLRTLESLSSDHERFLEADGNPANVKLFNNALRPAIAPVALRNVIIPVLHLDLGIFPWIFDAFQTEVRVLDAKLAGSTASTPEDSAEYSKLAGLHVELKQCMTEIADSQDKLQTVGQYLQAVAVQFADRPDIEAAVLTIQQHFTSMEQHHNSLVSRKQKFQAEVSASAFATRFRVKFYATLLRSLCRVVTLRSYIGEVSRSERGFTALSQVSARPHAHGVAGKLKINKKHGVEIVTSTGM